MADNKTQQRLKKRKEAAAYLGISTAHLDRLKSRGEIEFVRIARKAVRFDEVSLERFVQERTMKMNPSAVRELRAA